MLNESPFFLIYGRDPKLPQDVLLGSAIKGNSRQISNQDLDQFKSQIMKVLKEAYDKLNKHKEIVQKKYKNYYDKFQKEIKIEINDLVMVYTPATVEGLSYKFLSHWEGPYEIIGRIDSVTYRIKKIKKSKETIMPVHVKRLKLYKPWQNQNKTIENGK